jgi:uncharacterized membrane protein YsdA (DUF1294 family)
MYAWVCKVFVLGVLCAAAAITVAVYTAEPAADLIVRAFSRSNGTHGGVNGTRGGLNGTHGSMNGTHGGINGTHGGINGTHGGMNDTQGGINDTHGGINGVGINGTHGGGVNDTHGGINGASDSDGLADFNGTQTIPAAGATNNTATPQNPKIVKKIEESLGNVKEWFEELKPKIEESLSKVKEWDEQLKPKIDDWFVQHQTLIRNIFGWYIGINVFELLWMAVDKMLAYCGGGGGDYTRIPELLLLLPVLLGGTIGFLVGMAVCCHKTSKVAFHGPALCCGLVAFLLHAVVIGAIIGTA